MPKFSISCWVNNKGTATVSAHVGASLVNVNDATEYYNRADDVKKNFKPGKTWVYRNLNTELGAAGIYDFYLALWEGEKDIGTGKKYISVMVPGAVEKKKKPAAVNLDITVPVITPASFFSD